MLMGRQNPFGRIPVDQTIEETVNKETQTPGGTKGFSLKPAALNRYYLIAAYRSTCLKKNPGTDQDNATWYQPS